MTDKTFMRADEVAEELDVSKAYAYKIIRQLNDELRAKGFITVSYTHLICKHLPELAGRLSQSFQRMRMSAWKC